MGYLEAIEEMISLVKNTQLLIYFIVHFFHMEYTSYSFVVSYYLYRISVNEKIFCCKISCRISLLITTPN